MRDADASLIAKARAGRRVSRIDKIATLDTLAEIDGFLRGVALVGPPLDPAEQAALAIRRAEIVRGRWA